MDTPPCSDFLPRCTVARGRGDADAGHSAGRRLPAVDRIHRPTAQRGRIRTSSGSCRGRPDTRSPPPSGCVRPRGSSGSNSICPSRRDVWTRSRRSARRSVMTCSRCRTARWLGTSWRWPTTRRSVTTMSIPRSPDTPTTPVSHLRWAHTPYDEVLEAFGSDLLALALEECARRRDALSAVVAGILTHRRSPRNGYLRPH